MVLARDGERQQIYFLEDSDQADPQTMSFAVLAPTALSLSLLPGLARPALHITGLHLVGNMIAGRPHAGTTDQLVAAISRLVETGQAPFVFFEVVHEDSPLWKALSAFDGASGPCLRPLVPAQPHWRIDFPSPASDYWNMFTRKSKYNLRRLSRLLEHELVCYREPDQVSELVAQATAVSKRSWQGRRHGLRVNESPAFHQYWRRLAALGAMRCYVLRHQGAPAAFALGVQWQDQYLFEETAFDTALAHLSPGRVLLFRMLQDLIETETPRVFDFGYGDGEYKQFFGNAQTRSQGFLLTPSSVKWRLALGLHETSRKSRDYLRQSLSALGLWRWLRRRYRMKNGGQAEAEAESHPPSSAEIDLAAPKTNAIIEPDE
jgi:hypothetical protein